MAAFILDDSTPPQLLLFQRNSDDLYAPGSYQILYGHIEQGEYPEQTLMREIAEETGFATVKLYTLNETFTFYEKISRTIQLTPLFAAFVKRDTPLRLDPREHCAAEWFSLEEAERRLTWPAQRRALNLLSELLRTGELPEIMRLETPA